MKLPSTFIQMVPETEGRAVSAGSEVVLLCAVVDHGLVVSSFAPRHRMAWTKLSELAVGALDLVGGKDNDDRTDVAWSHSDRGCGRL